MSTDKIKRWEDRAEAEHGFLPGDAWKAVYMLAEIVELRAALAAQYREFSYLVEMQPGGALYQPPAPVGYLFGNSYYEVGNPRLTEEIKRLGKARYGEPQAPSAPVAGDYKDLHKDILLEMAANRRAIVCAAAEIGKNMP